MKSLRLLFMGTPDFAIPALDALHKSQHEVVAVYTQPPRPGGRGKKERLTPVHEYALKAGITVHTPVTLKEQAIQKELANYKADAIIVAAYGLLLPEGVLEAAPLGCINIHPSLLPRWRGAAPVERCIMAGDKETGIVIMQMDKGLDTGAMLAVQSYPVDAECNSGALRQFLSQQAAHLLLATLEGLITGTVIPVAQPETGVTYASKLTKEESRINWHDSAETIHHKIRGLAPAPAASFSYKGETIKILEARWVSTSSTAVAGTIIDTPLVVACGKDALSIRKLQRAGKNQMSVEEMLRGFKMERGDVVG